MINIENLSVNLCKFSLNNINIEVDSGEFFVLLGPTGSGKTVLIESIAGLKIVESGKIIVNNRDITDYKPEKRNISICYQDCALFSHMTVKQNIMYGLKFKKDKNDLKYIEKFNMLINILKIDNILDRYPIFLSGGEKQRVSLARALIVNPDVLLLDEPLSALDPDIKESIEYELKNIQNALKITTIMVTHSFDEAHYFGDKIGILYEGNILQKGTLQEIFHKPNSVFVAKFMGMKNIFEVKDENMALKYGVKVGDFIGIRPEDIIISIDDFNIEYKFQGIILRAINTGIYMNIEIACNNSIFIIYLTINIYFQLHLNEGMKVYFGFFHENLSHIFNR